jgi:hypothetical protein
MHPSFGKSALAVAALVGAVACSSDSTSPTPLHPPDGATCTQGTISANGPAVSGAISTTTDCKLADAWDGDSVYAASYAVAVTAGKMYSLTATGQASGNGYVENLLIGLTAADTEELLAASSSWDSFTGGADNNVLWFYAPTGGTYSLRVLDSDTSYKTMAYTMQLATCPIVATVAASDTTYSDSTSSIGTGGCKQQYTFFGGDDSTYVNYYLVQFAPGQTRFFNVTSAAFSGGWEIGGPNFDSMWDINGNGNASSNSSDYESVQADSGGTYTLAVGSTTVGGSGAYTLNVLPPSLIPQRVPGAPLKAQAAHLSPSRRLHILR